MVPEMRKCQKEKADEVGSGGTRSYSRDAWRSCNPFEGGLLWQRYLLLRFLRST